MTNREKSLFISLWICILLGALIWKFWPKESVVALMDVPEVTLSEELRPLIDKANLNRATPSQYIVQVTLNEDFVRKFSGNRGLLIGYELKKNETLGGGVLTMLAPKNSREAVLTVSNPRRVSAREIHLFLAR